MKCFIKHLKRDSVFDMKKIYLFCICFSLAGFAIGKDELILHYRVTTCVHITYLLPFAVRFTTIKL